MNILYLNNSIHLGGDTKCILKLCKEFSKDNNVFIASSGGALVEEFEMIGVRHYKINSVKSKSIGNIVSNIIKLRKIIKGNKIELIHSHHRMTTLVAKLATKFSRVEVVHTQHSCINDKLKLTKIALNKIQTITVSDAAKRILTKSVNLDENKITTIYNTIELKAKSKEVDSRLLELKKDGYFVVAQVSRLVEDKGIYDFIEIAKRTIEVNNKIKFVLIGEGPDYLKLERKIIENGLSEHIILLGKKLNVIEHLKHIDLLLLCSYIEGLPLTPIEAFSQGVPVIATNIDGTNEEIIDGYNGYLADIKDIEKFSEKIYQIFNDTNLHKNLSMNSIKMFNENFTTDKYIKEHSYVYEKLIKNKEIS